MKKNLLAKIVAVATMLSLLLTACGGGGENGETDDNGKQTSQQADSGDTDSGDTIKIGLVTPLTGTLAFGSNEVKNAMELAVEKRPEVLGKKVEFIAADAADAQQAMSEFERLRGNGVKYFLGGYGTFMDLAIQQVVDDRDAILISCSGWANELTETPYKNYFHFNPRVEVFGQKMAEYLEVYAKEYLGKTPEETKVGVVWNTNVQYVADAALPYLKEAGFQVVVEEGYPIDRKDFTSTIQKLQSNDVDVFVPCQQSPDGIPFRKKMVEVGYEPPMTFAMGLIYDQPDFGKLGADIVDGTMALSYTHPSINTDAAPGLKEFKESYNKKYGWDPLTHATQTYAGTMFLFDMIEEAGEDDVSKVQEAIVNCDIPKGVYPNYWGVKFDENHRNTRAGDPLVIGQWQNGELLAVGTEEIKTNDAVIPWKKK